MEKEVDGSDQHMGDQQCGIEDEKKTHLEGQNDEIELEGKDELRLPLDKQASSDQNYENRNTPGNSKEENFLKLYMELRKIFRKNDGNEDGPGVSREKDKIPLKQQRKVSKVRTGKVQKPYFECFTCHFRFKKKCKLREHVVAHAIPCLVCNNQYFSQGALDLHLAMHAQKNHSIVTRTFSLKYLFD